jgi:ribosomal protein L16/L10AE
MKYKKYFKIKYSNNNAIQFDSLYSGTIGLKSLANCNLTTEQILAAIKSIKRVVKKKNFLIIRAQPF